MDERHYIFLTGRLAKPRLERVLAGLAEPGLTFEVRDIGVKVAALMTEPIIARRLPRPVAADRVCCRALPRRPRTPVGAFRRAVRTRTG